MILAIDATNIRNGGGLTHLKQLILEGNPLSNNIDKIIIWSSKKTLDQLPNRPWLEKKSHKLLNKSFIYSFIFQYLYLSRFLKNDKVDLLFVPGGTFIGKFKPFVSMSQNMLPFEKIERNRFPSILSKLRFIILERTQSYTFENSELVIFLSKYARDYVNNIVNIKKHKIISHGINLNFSNVPKEQNDINIYTNKEPFKLLYVSTVNVYKHQWNVCEAVLKLRNEGFSISLDLIGGATPESLRKLNQVIAKDEFNCIFYKGLVKYEELASIYKSADGFIFASSCENQPIILLEAMSAGLPIISSNMGPMPEVLGDGQFYFDPLNIDSIYENLKEFLIYYKKRESLVKYSYQSSLEYTWKECANETFKTLTEIFNYANNKK